MSDTLLEKLEALQTAVENEAIELQEVVTAAEEALRLAQYHLELKVAHLNGVKQSLGIAREDVEEDGSSVTIVDVEEEPQREPQPAAPPPAAPELPPRAARPPQKSKPAFLGRAIRQAVLEILEERPRGTTLGHLTQELAKTHKTDRQHVLMALEYWKEQRQVQVIRGGYYRHIKFADLPVRQEELDEVMGEVGIKNGRGAALADATDARERIIELLAAAGDDGMSRGDFGAAGIGTVALANAARDGKVRVVYDRYYAVPAMPAGE